MLNSVIGLLIALGILVTIHEYGHFWVARRCGVKVLRFSIGFGQPIFRWSDKQGTEFVVAWIPLGGYVKMLDEREGDVPQDQLSQAFTQKTPVQKIAIALAGPLANLAFAILAFTGMYIVGVKDFAPILDLPQIDTPAYQAGIERGDKIVTVDGNAVDSFTDLTLALASRVGDTGEIVLTIDRRGLTNVVQLPIESWLSDQQTPNPLFQLGIMPKSPIHPAVIGRLEENAAAAKAGLKVDDEILQIDMEPITDWLHLVEVIKANPERNLVLLVQRSDEVISITLSPELKESEGNARGYIGAATKPVPWPKDQLMTERYLPWQALVKGVNDAGQMLSLSYQMLWKMITGKISLKQVGGPIAMAQMAGMSIESGLEAFTQYLAFISLSLAIMNLLPIPILDGGHIVMHGIEWITKRPISERIQIIWMQAGLFFIASLMILVTFNDIGRLM